MKRPLFALLLSGVTLSTSRLTNIELAVASGSARDRLTKIEGGPGAGKTTIVNATPRVLAAKDGLSFDRLLYNTPLALCLVRLDVLNIHGRHCHNSKLSGDHGIG
jgi:hypothetical protein